MYNLSVATAHTFLVGDTGWLAHNCGGAKGLIGHAFEDYLVKTLGRKGSFSRGGREFDGAIGNRWYEAKSGGYWDRLLPGSEELKTFKDSMRHRKRIANDNHATYELHSNTPIPQHIKDCLSKKGFPFFEHLE